MLDERGFWEGAMLGMKGNGLPIGVQIGPVVYAVELVEDLRDAEGGRLLGQASAGSLAIRLDSKQPPAGLEVTLAHEIVHLILEHAGHMEAAEDEGLIRALSYGALGVRLLWGEP